MCRRRHRAGGELWCRRNRSGGSDRNDKQRKSASAERDRKFHEGDLFVVLSATKARALSILASGPSSRHRRSHADGSGSSVRRSALDLSPPPHVGISRTRVALAAGIRSGA